MTPIACATASRMFCAVRPVEPGTALVRLHLRRQGNEPRALTLQRYADSVPTAYPLIRAIASR